MAAPEYDSVRCDFCGHKGCAQVQEDEVPVDHKAEARGSQIVDCPPGENEDPSRAFREAQDAVAHRLRQQSEGVYDASSDSIVYSKAVVEQVKAESEMAAADHILEFYEGKPMSAEEMAEALKSGARVLLVDQPKDSGFPDGEYRVVAGQRITNFSVDPDPQGWAEVNQHKGAGELVASGDDRLHVQFDLEKKAQEMDILEDGEAKQLGFTTIDRRGTRLVYDASVDSVVPDTVSVGEDEETFIEMYDEGERVGMLFIPKHWSYEQTAEFAAEWKKRYHAMQHPQEQLNDESLPDGLYRTQATEPTFSVPSEGHEAFAEKMASLLNTPDGLQWLREHRYWNGTGWETDDKWRYKEIAGQPVTNIQPPEPADETMTRERFEKMHAQPYDHNVRWPSGDSSNEQIFLNGSWRSRDEYNQMIADQIVDKVQTGLQPGNTFQVGATSSAIENDPVNHPSHYTAYPGIEVIQLTRWLGFNKGNAVKYIARAGLKSTDTKEQDLEKAIWYLKDELALLRGEHGVFEG